MLVGILGAFLCASLSSAAQVTALKLQVGRLSGRLSRVNTSSIIVRPNGAESVAAVINRKKKKHHKWKKFQEAHPLAEEKPVTVTEAPDSEPSKDLPAIFLHIPKNAGSAIEEAGYSEHMRWGRHMTWGTVQMPDGYWCNKYHLPPAYLPDPVTYLKGRVFCVVRHPFDRAVSEYKYLLGVAWGHTVQNYVELPGEDICDPDSLNGYLQEAMGVMKTGSKFFNDCHMIPQHEYVKALGQTWCQDVLRHEDLPGAFDKLMEERGYDVRLKEATNIGSVCANLTTADLSDETKTLLLDVYQDDFKLLNFPTSFP